jgi:tRNA(Met) cytidine acetyltransferase
VFAPLISDEDKVLDVKEAVITKNKLNEVHLRLIEKSDLINNESTLKAILGLLVQSHYQTTPDDIMRILDAPDHHIAILTHSSKTSSALINSSILSVVVFVDESLLGTDIDEDLLDKIICASRRINGYLVAQNLASTYSDVWFLNSKNWRIMRIAVQPHLRRLGLASSMLSQIEKLAKEQGIDYISTSFGFTNELFCFWQSQGYKLIKIGARRDTSSGEHSSIWVLPVNAKAVSQFTSYVSIMLNDMDFLVDMILKNNKDEDWWLNKSRLLDDLATGITLLGGETKNREFKSILSQDEKEQETQQALRTHHARLNQFIQGKRSYANAAASVYFYFKQQGIKLDLLADIQQKNHSQAKKATLINEIKLCIKKYI